jgi:hypothetical protein
MAHPGRFESRVVQRWSAGFLSAALHLGLLLVVVLSGNQRDGVHAGDTPITQLVLLEALNADERDGIDSPPLEPALPTPEIEEPVHARIEPPAAPPTDTFADEPDVADLVLPEEDPPTAIVPEAIPTPATVTVPPAEKAALSQRLAQLAEQLAKPSPAHVEWEQDGRQYSAVLILERANEGTALDRVIAEVSAAESGKQFTTRIALKRLPFSQFTQMVDRWDPMVQLHDDEIVGRFHTNSSFNLMYDSRTAPKFLGKVTTAARTFHTDSMGRKRESDIFKGGLETRAGRIPLPEALQPFEWAPRDENARVHELATDTRIMFFADGGYTLRARNEATTGYVNEPSEHPIYFIARPGVTLFVQGVLAGKVLIYSPYKIVVEDSLTYAHDPRVRSESPDYLGLVSDRYISIAPPGVTGPGDLEIHAAIFAGRRFVVTNIDHRRSATLRIYGSLSAGSISASEPRYATRIEYDRRFDERRPPGFPSTNRFEVEEWNGEWTEVSERIADDAL